MKKDDLLVMVVLRSPPLGNIGQLTIKIELSRLSIRTEALLGEHTVFWFEGAGSKLAAHVDSHGQTLKSL